jgi:hypothetical protein
MVSVELTVAPGFVPDKSFPSGIAAGRAGSVDGYVVCAEALPGKRIKTKTPENKRPGRMMRRMNF